MMDTLADVHEPARKAAELAGERAPDIVDALNREAPEVATDILRALPFAVAVEVLDQPGLDDAPGLLARLPDAHAARLLDAMAADRAADVFRELDEPRRSELLTRLDLSSAAALRELLAYPEGTAGSIMTTEFVNVPADWKVGQTLEHIRHVESCRETVYSIFIHDPATGSLLRAMPLRRLIIADPDTNILEAGPPRRLISVSPTCTREDATRLISKYDLLAVPVVDAANRPIGIVTVDDVIDAIVQESTEEVQRFGGVEALGEPYLRIGFWAMIRKRAGWLCALFVSEMLTASAMQGFESELEKALVLTLFIPLIMSSGGNSGSQASSLLIRALALKEVALRDWWRVGLRELPTGILLGATLGVIGVIRITIWQQMGLYDYGVHWPLVALTVGAALVGIVTFGSMTGSLLPFLLQRLGFDPASASAPFVATLVDVTGLVIYFSIAALILHGTLL